MWCSIGAVSVAGFHGQTGSAGAQASNESHGAAQARFHGVLAPNSLYRESVTPLSASQVEPATADVEAEGPDEPDLRAGRCRGLCWAKRLKRVFNIDVSACIVCGDPMRIIASIEDPMVIGKILSHLEATSCAPPAGETMGWVLSCETIIQVQGVDAVIGRRRQQRR